MEEGKKPLGVGFFFSLGHSTVVMALALALGFAASRVAAEITSDNSALKSYGGLIGTSVSDLFLYLIVILNIIILIDVIRVFREMCQGKYDEERLKAQLASRGFMNRFFRRLARDQPQLA